MIIMDAAALLTADLVNRYSIKMAVFLTTPYSKLEQAAFM